MKNQINLQYGYSQPFQEQFPPGSRLEQSPPASVGGNTQLSPATAEWN